MENHEFIAQALSERDYMLLTSLVIILILNLVSVLLYPRLTARSHVTFASLTILMSAMACFALLGSAFFAENWMKTGGFISLIILFKLMNQFEINKEPPPKPKEDKK